MWEALLTGRCKHFVDDVGCTASLDDGGCACDNMATCVTEKSARRSWRSFEQSPQAARPWRLLNHTASLLCANEIVHHRSLSWLDSRSYVAYVHGMETSCRHPQLLITSWEWTPPDDARVCSCFSTFINHSFALHRYTAPSQYCIEIKMRRKKSLVSY